MVQEATWAAVKKSCLLDVEKRNNDFPSNPHLPVIKSTISCGANVRWNNLKPWVKLIASKTQLFFYSPIIRQNEKFRHCSWTNFLLFAGVSSPTKHCVIKQYEISPFVEETGLLFTQVNVSEGRFTSENQFLYGHVLGTKSIDQMRHTI